MQVQIGFVERLVIFWTNHFSMTGQQERDRARHDRAAGSATSSASMCSANSPTCWAASMKHPAMIAYLDNADSIGPNSPTGKSWGVGFNENLAREIDGAAHDRQRRRLYRGRRHRLRQDPDRLVVCARLGGGRRATTAARKQNRGQFIFRADWHEPGADHADGQDLRRRWRGPGERV